MDREEFEKLSAFEQAQAMYPGMVPILSYDPKGNPIKGTKLKEDVHLKPGEKLTKEQVAELSEPWEGFRMAPRERCVKRKGQWVRKIDFVLDVLGAKRVREIMTEGGKISTFWDVFKDRQGAEIAVRLDFLVIEAKEKLESQFRPLVENCSK